MASPRRIGKFEVVRLLATGGMGEVFLARQVGAGGFSRAVVVKRLLPHLARDAAFVQMFLNEGRLAGMLAHPNIAQIYELGEDDGSYYLAMEFIHGRSLRQLETALKAKERLIGAPIIARIAIDALQGLHAAHTLEIDGKPTAVVHRDMSPDNILVGFKGISRVIDFGVARAADAASTTRTGTLKGKFAYMAPERFEDPKSEIDPRVDIYAMAVALYEALCGRRPFGGDSDALLVGAILTGRPVPLHEVNPLVDVALSELVMKGLRRQATERWSTAEAMANGLESWLTTVGRPTPTAAVAELMRSVFGDAEADRSPSVTKDSMMIPSEVSEPGTRAAMRSRWALAAALVLVAAVGAVAIGSLGGRGHEAPATPTNVVSPVVPVAVVPAPAENARKGRVAFRVKPWGEIWQGDQRLGVTPNVVVERPAGRHTFTIKNPDHPPREIAVEVLPDTEVSVKVDLTAN